MKQFECDCCGNTYLFANLILNKETGGYLCPTCYCKNVRNPRIVEKILYFIIGALLAALIFGGISDQFSDIFK